MFFLLYKLPKLKVCTPFFPVNYTFYNLFLLIYQILLTRTVRIIYYMLNTFCFYKSIKHVSIYYSKKKNKFIEKDKTYFLL